MATLARPMQRAFVVVLQEVLSPLRCLLDVYVDLNGEDVDAGKVVGFPRQTAVTVIEACISEFRAMS